MELEAYGHSKISIHALREEGDPDAAIGADAVVDFYPRPPRGGRPLCQYAELQLLAISIHALREEGDARFCGGQARPREFLSTPSARRATWNSGNRNSGD